MSLVTFDGVNKLININAGVSLINVKSDIYSEWKRWAILSDNSKFLPAFRVTGGDPIGSGNFTGDIYFVTNGWRIYIDHSCIIEGDIFSDNYPTPYYNQPGTNIVTNKVSALTQIIAPTISGITIPTATENATAIWADPAATALQSKLNSVDTKIDNMSLASALAVRAELSIELARLDANISSRFTTGDFLALS